MNKWMMSWKESDWRSFLCWLWWVEKRCNWVALVSIKETLIRQSLTLFFGLIVGERFEDNFILHLLKLIMFFNLIGSKPMFHYLSPLRPSLALLHSNTKVPRFSFWMRNRHETWNDKNWTIQHLYLLQYSCL